MNEYSTLADVADRAQVESVFKEGIGRLGGLDVLVNNAGISGPTAPVEVIEPADWDRCIGVTLTSLSIELGPSGIRVNAVLPGLVEGDRLRRVLQSKAAAKGVSYEEAEAEFVSCVALKKTVRPRKC